MQNAKPQMESSFEDLLRAEFHRRHAKNPSYSLRAFARSIEQDASSVSKILTGKRKVGQNLLRKLSTKLGLSEDEVKQFQTKSRFDARRKGEPIEYQTMQMDILEAIVDWYHNAILLLTELDDFKPDTAWIAERLDVPEPKIKEAIDRLIRFNLLDVTGEKWKATTTTFTALGTKPVLTSEALRLAQRQFLEKAMKSLLTVPVELRDQSSLSFSFNQEDLPLVREYIKKFRRRLDSLASRTSKKDSIYTISVSLFPLTKVTGAKND